MKIVGQTIKTQIKFRFEETRRTLIWPITLESLGHVDPLPNLNELLSNNIFNKGYEHEINSKKSRLIIYTGQDIYHAATQVNGNFQNM